MGPIGRMTGRLPLGPMAALLLGFAGGFVAWALPAALLGAIMRHLHVMALLPQAAPPYSALTRIGLAVVAGIVLAAIVLVGFRRLETRRWPWTRDADEQPVAEDDEPAAPRLRRADRHPDAPARRPLFAKELLLETPFGDPEADAEAEAEPEAAPVAGLAPSAPTIRRGSLFAEPAPVAAEIADDRSAPAPLAAPVPPLPAPALEEVTPPVTTPAPARLPTAGASIADLMARLEAGLVRHDRTPDVSAPVTDVPLGDALRDALADLQKMARR